MKSPLLISSLVLASLGGARASEICQAEIEADNAYAAAELFAGEKFNASIGEDKGWELQRAQDRRRNELLVDQFIARFQAEASSLTIGQLRAKFTPTQFQNLVTAARRGNSFRYGDPIYAAAVGAKLQAGMCAANEQRRKFGRGWKRKREDLSGRYSTAFWSLPEHQRNSPLARFYYQLADQKREIAEKKQRALDKRRAPMRALALHIARQMHRYKPRFGQTGDGIRYGMSSGNSGNRRHGGPGTRCEAGVTYAKGKLHFYPTHGGKPFSIPAPPMSLRKNARPGIAHPDGLFCRASAEYPAVDENWGLPPDRYWLSKEWKMFSLSIRGVRISERVAKRDFTIQDALTEANTEVRRIMLELLPPHTLEEGGALELRHSDDFGSLYIERPVNQRDGWDENRLAFVKVCNSTPEPDGTYKDYWLRVPGNLQRAKQAVAWTFGLTEEQYQPIVQS